MIARALSLHLDVAALSAVAIIAFIMGFAAIAALQLLAGLLDIGENLCLLQLLDGQREAWLPLAAYWLAAVKFTLVGLGILTVLAGLLVPHG